MSNLLTLYCTVLFCTRHDTTRLESHQTNAKHNILTPYTHNSMSERAPATAHSPAIPSFIYTRSANLMK